MEISFKDPDILASYIAKQLALHYRQQKVLEILNIWKKLGLLFA